MKTRQLVTRGGLMVAGTLTILLAAGCGGLQSGGTASPGTSSGASGATVATSTTTGTDASGPPPPTFTQTGGASGGGGPVPNGECRSAALKLSLGQSDGTAGTVYTALKFTNVSASNCVLAGFPGVSYVAIGNGKQIGAPAVRDGAMGSQVMLKPGDVASTVVGMVDVGVFDPNSCRPTPVAGFRVYPPDETASMFVALPSGTGCAGNPPSPQLKVQTIKPGPGAP